MNEIIEVTAKDNHQFSAYISQPSGKPKAGIVIIQEIFGVNKHIKELTDLYASYGYLCIAPSLFDRIEKNVTLSYDEKGVSKGRDLKELCNNYALKDIEASISVVSSAGKVGVIGYCWGGSLSWRIGCEVSHLSASVCYYGGDIPKLRNLKPKCNVLTHFGELDKGIPLKDVRIFEKKRPEVHTYTYPADHGFNCDHRSQYDKTCAVVAFDRTLKFLEKNLD
jgi:carboxymethylenebutenolidase